MNELNPEILRCTIDGPFGVAGKHDRKIFTDPAAELFGVYFFAIPYAGGGYIVSYVGKTKKSFRWRTREHMLNYMSGLYTAKDVDAQMRGERRYLWYGLTKDYPYRMEEFLDRMPELVQMIQKKLRTMVVFTAPLDLENRMLLRVEGAFAQHFSELDGPAGALVTPKLRYSRRWESEAPLDLSVLCPFRILGMPMRISV